MALLDMIHDAMKPQVSPEIVKDHERDLSSGDRLAIESLGGLGELPKTEEPAPVEDYLMDASDALRAIESHMEMDQAPNEVPYFEALHEALEANLPTETPPYDPTAELEEIEQTLAGIDADNTPHDVDQPQPEEDIEKDSTINDLMTSLEDRQDDEPDAQGILNL